MDEITSETLHAFSTLAAIVRNEPVFIENCSKLNAKLEVLQSLAVKYDLSETQKVNGFRSFIKLLNRFANLVLSQCEANSKYEIDSSIVLISNLLLTAAEMIVPTCDQQLMSGNGYKSIAFAFNLQEELKAIYGKNRNFWLCSSMRCALNLYITLLITVLKPSSLLFGGLFNDQFKSETYSHFALNTSTKFIKKLWSLSELFVYRKFLPFLLYGFRPKIAKTVYIPLKRLVTIDPITNELKVDKNETEKRRIRCRFLQNSECNSFLPVYLVLHCHGAGFISQTPDSHEIYLRDWANKLCGTPILSIDYSLSPENKYPTALQELVDIYFALTSQSAEIKELLGFNPENIILCGDSAGGSLIIALTLVLNDVRKKIDVKMPKEIVAIYPLTLLRLNPSPSRIFTLFDTFLTVGVVLCVADAYSRIVNCDLDFAQNDSADFNKEKVWYRREIFERRLQEINKMAECAYLSPLLYEDFNSLNDVGLSIVVGEFDPLLDDGVELIKRWKGKKQLDVVENLTHGFLYFKAISKEANEACELALQKIIQVCSAI